MGRGAPAPSWCPACGADRPVVPSHGHDRPCAECGTSPVLGPVTLSPLGTVHRVGLRRRPGLCVGVDDDRHALLLPSGGIVHRGSVTPGGSPVLDDLPALRCGLGLLFAHLASALAGDPRVPWGSGPLRDAARAAARADPAAARRAALDLLDLDAAHLLPDLGLPEPEWRWPAAVDASRRGDAEALIDHVAALPHGRFRGTVTLLAARLRDVQAVAGAGERLGPALEAWSGREPLAATVARALGTARADTASRCAADVLQRARHVLAVLGDDEAAAQAAGVLEGVPDASLPTRLGPACRAVVALRDPLRHRGLLQAPDLRWLPTPVLEDAVAAGVLDVDRVRVGLVDDPRQAGVVAQLDPAALGADELDVDPDEAARRTFLDGREPPDCGLGPRGRHLTALAALRRGRFAEVRPEDVLPGWRRDVERLCTAARLAADGSRHHVAVVAGPDLLADRTVWPVLDEMLGEEAADDGSGTPLPVESWRALRRARGELYARRWSGAVRAARPALADAAADPRVRAEALNLTACAVLHDDGPDARERAARALEHALRVHPSTALRINRALVLADTAPEAAAESLVAVADGPATAGLRRTIAFEALRLWRADRGAWSAGEDGGLPRTVRDLLRRAAVEHLAIDDFREVVVALARWDASWVAEPAHLAESPHRDTREARYHRALAAEDHEGRIAVLAEVSDWPEAPRWLADERDRLVASLVRTLRAGQVDDVVAGRRAIDVAHRLRDGLGERTRVELALLGLAALHHAARRAPDVDLEPSVALLHWARASRRTLGEDEDLLAVERIATQRVAREHYEELARRYRDALPQVREHMRVVNELRHTKAELGEHYVAVRAFIGTARRAAADAAGWRELTDGSIEAAFAKLERIAREAAEWAEAWIRWGGRPP